MDNTQAIAISQAVSQQDYDLFAFGDSLSDTGNLFRTTLGLAPPSPPYFNGRFSNGPVAVETLATQLGVNFSDETNFAIGGARTNRTNNGDSPLIQPGGLLDEIDRFKAKASELGAGAEDLYFVWAGANDLLNNSADVSTVVQDAVSNITSVVTTLSQLGAKNIIVAKTPNLGRTPTAQDGRSQLLTDLSQSFNASLESTLTGLEGTLGANIILTDLFSTAEAIAATPSAFGFSNITDPFLNGLLPADPSADPDRFFFWDNVHPTTRAHDIFADTFRRSIVSGITEDINRNGTPDQDKLIGFSGNDRLRGLGGQDLVEGNAGSDTLLGGSGADTLVGGGNRDLLVGGGEQDTLRGGLGNDRFIYNSSDEGRDTIVDFQPGRDSVDLINIFTQPGYSRPNRFDAYVRLAQGSDGTVVRVDTNGDITGGFKALALLSNVNANELTAASFLVS